MSVKIPLLGSALYAQVDAEDADLAGLGWRAGRPPYGYAVRRVVEGDGRVREERLHVVVARRLFGAIPAGQVVETRDGHRLNCRRGNLYLAGKGKQLRDRAAQALGGVPSRYEGVTFHPASGLWWAGMRVGRDWLRVGAFPTEAEAARAYDAAARRRYGPHARCNFPAE